MVLKYFVLVVIVLQLDLFSREGIGINAIYRGKSAIKDKFKWLALVHSDDDLLCHGVLVSSEYVLTLASCVKEAVVTNVILGEYDRSVIGDGEQNISVKQVILHPENSFLSNNIALLELQIPVNLSSPCVEPIKNFATPEIDEELVSTSARKCQIAGWGESLNEGKWVLSNRPYELKVIKEKDQVCRNLGLTGIAQYSCFKMAKFHSGPCYKDNGTPVIYKVKGKKIFIGLMYGQFSVDGCVGGVKLVSKASSFKNWLNIYIPSIKVDPRKPML